MLALGIDPGEDALSLALVELSGRTPRLVGAWREPRSALGLAEHVRAMRERHCPAAPDAVATALPGRQATFRLLRLPFVDPARLAATVPFELESVVPFDLAEAVTSHVPVERADGQTTVLAAIATREAVRRHLDEMREAGIDPAIVEVGPIATAGIFERGPGDLLVVEAREDGALALLRQGSLAALHALDAGTASGDEEMRRRLRWSLLATSGEGVAPKVAAIGAGADVARSVAAEAGIPVTDAHRLLPTWLDAAPLENLRAIALAARAAGIAKTGTNLRSGDLSYHAPSEEARRQMRSTGVLAAVAAGLALASLGATVAARRSELAALRSRIASEVRSVLPGAAPGGERDQLESAIEGLRKRRSTLTGASGERPPVLELMRSILAAVPERIPFEVDDFALDPDGLRMHARTDSYESVDVIKRALKDVPGARDAEVKDVKTGVDGRVEFRASVDLGPKDAS